MVSKVRGSFTEVSGEIVVAEDPTASTVTASIQADSITTGVEQRDGHIRTGDFLEVEKYPTLEFRTHRPHVERRQRVHARRRTHDQGRVPPGRARRRVRRRRRSPYGKEVFGFTAKTEIDREDWGITYNMALEAGGFMVSKNVKIEIEGEAVRQD